MSPKQLAADLRIKLFADHGTNIQSAMDYAAQVLNSLGTEGVAARTAMHVVLNTLANVLDEMPDPADHPAVGVEPVQLQMDRDALDAIISARIESWADEHLDARVGEQVEEWMNDNFDPEYLVKDALENIDFEVRIR